jgi:hypothetical protein
MRLRCAASSFPQSSASMQSNFSFFFLVFVFLCRSLSDAVCYVLWFHSHIVFSSVRFLNIHEWQSKDLLKGYGITVQKFGVARSASEAKAIAESLHAEVRLFFSTHFDFFFFFFFFFFFCVKLFVSQELVVKGNSYGQQMT